MNAFMAGAKETNPEGRVQRRLHRLAGSIRPRPRKPPSRMIDKGADVMYAERFGVSDAAKERKASSPSATSSTRRTQYPDTVVASALWNMEPTIDRAHQAGQGRQVQGRGLRPLFDDEGQGLGARAARHVREEGAGRRSWPRSRRRRRRSRTASSPSRSTTTSRSRPLSSRRAAPIGPAMPTPVLRLSGITKRFGALVANDAISLELGARRGAGAARRERRRQVDAGDHPVRPLRRRRRARSRSFGQPLPPGEPAAALAAGIGMVHQHFTLADNLTRARQHRARHRAAVAAVLAPARRARASSPTSPQRFGLAVDPDARVGSAVGRRAPARRDPEGALPRRPHPDPRRADGGADAAGERGAVRHARPAGGARACRSSSSATSWTRCCASRTASRCCAAAGWSARRATAGTDARRSSRS